MTVDATIDDVLAGRAQYAVACSRAEDFATGIPDGAVNGLFTDPPFFRAIDEPWDNAWPNAAAFLAWLSSVAGTWPRILAPNGSLYVFASAEMGTRVEMLVREHFEVLTNIRWAKPFSRANASCKEELRSYFPASETIIFAEQRGAELVTFGADGYAAKDASTRASVFEPLRAYLDGERMRAGVTSTQVQRALGNQMAGHYFGRSQWTLPTAENYAKLRACLNANGGDFLVREYEGLRVEYEGLLVEYEGLLVEYEGLRRPFAASADRPYVDTWTFPTVQAYDGKHVCEKPETLAAHVIETSSRPGDVVADFFCGSGVFLATAVAMGRRAIGCDMDPHWADFARRRCEMARATGRTSVRKVGKSEPEQASLFGGAP